MMVQKIVKISNQRRFRTQDEPTGRSDMNHGYRLCSSPPVQDWPLGQGTHHDARCAQQSPEQPTQPWEENFFQKLMGRRQTSPAFQAEVAQEGSQWQMSWDICAMGSTGL